MIDPLPEEFEGVFSFIDAHKDRFVEDLIRICEVPAPPFHEAARAQFFASLFRENGFVPRMDSVGNVIIPVTRNESPKIVVSAHLDTVFPFKQIQVERDDALLRAPGISDDSSGLAALLLIAEAFQECGVTSGSLTILATVGEEGLGNLRGAKHFFQQTRDVDYFISLDGSDAEKLVTTGLASKRFRVSLKGPGGHSWGDAGTPNPIHLAGEFLAAINRLEFPLKPKTTLNVGVISGGTSVNAIPSEVHLDVDLRSESAESLQWLDQFVREELDRVAAIREGIDSEIEILGERPSGAVAPGHRLVQTAMAANKHFGLRAKLDTGSTDSNIPFSLGIPALTIGVGGKSGKIHTPDEWYDVTDVERGLKRTALLLLLLIH